MCSYTYYFRFAAVNLDRSQGGQSYGKVIDALAEDDIERVNFLKACLLKLGLNVSDDKQAVPSLSRLHLSGAEKTNVTELLAYLKEIIASEADEDYIRGENDTFLLENPSRWSMGDLKKDLPGSEDSSTNGASDQDKIINYDAVVKRIVAHESDYPSCKDTPYFNHHAFFSNLKHYQTISKSQTTFGKHLLYGEVVTSTNTMLEK